MALWHLRQLTSKNLNVVEAAKVIDEKLGGVTLSDVPIWQKPFSQSK